MILKPVPLLFAQNLLRIIINSGSAETTNLSFVFIFMTKGMLRRAFKTTPYFPKKVVENS